MKADGEFLRIDEEDVKNSLTKDFTLRLFKNFTVNTENSVLLLALPIILISDGFQSAKYAGMVIAELVKQGMADKLDDPKFKEDIDKFASDIRKTGMGLTPNKEITKDASEYFTYLTSKSLPIRNAVRSLLQNVIVNTWTNYESNCKDLWIESVNSSPNTVINNDQIFNEKRNEIEGLAGKQIQISLLSKYDYNIKNHLGTILHSKFDFTSCSGIYDAFTKTYKNLKPVDFLKDEQLRQLEFARNLIVHRSGKIDAEYIKLSKKIDLVIGDVIDYDFETISEFSNKKTEAFYELVKVVDKVE